ncbi:hypothetical protein E8P82_13335 [Arthrobacter echini]|uniref:Asparagine synthetase domain-containing protein n=1 Tax=Arthrobacter echini TaxID=1529066 RepID=A0A4S5E0W5_9MICC|nr:hypothetical protein [Arthrobacter echini]THJ64968.1 hypothetical protein E8P82_13335 [Arthrobacter echini]
MAASDDRHVAVIGIAFDPERGLYDHDVILEQLLGDSRNEEVFLETLDRLAGRFAVVVHTPARTEIYQDAMGSRSVFYSTAGPAVAASHAELVREAIGTHFADFFIPFITSRNYLQRDVKYLPGVATPYENVLQLTPNTKLVMPEQRTERFWPREPIGGALENGAAVDSLIHHLEGMAAFVTYQKRRPVMGLTAGSDSRGMFAALKDLDPYVFTYVRSENGTAVNSKDARAAREAGELHGLQTNVWPIQNRLGLNAVDDSFSHAYRLATAYYRGAGSAWLSRLAELRSDIPTGIFIRGFGGEIMRGFYQLLSKRIVHVSVGQLSNAYDVNAGSKITRRFFADMMERTQFTDAHLQGYDPNDIFYWEHRMGTWGSVSLTEADLAMTSMVGYNSRNLYMTFMRLSGADRASRVAFQRATSALAPKLADAIS